MQLHISMGVMESKASLWPLVAHHPMSYAYLPSRFNGYHLRPVYHRNMIPGQPSYLVHQPNIGRNKGVNLPLRQARANCGVESCRHNQPMTAIYRMVATPTTQPSGKGPSPAPHALVLQASMFVPECIAGTHLLSRRAVPRRN